MPASTSHFKRACGGGLDMMRAASKAAKDTAAENDLTAPLMIAVTVLTSLEDDDLNLIGVNATPRDQVLRLADLAQQADMGGLSAQRMK